MKKWFNGPNIQRIIYKNYFSIRGLSTIYLLVFMSTEAVINLRTFPLITAIAKYNIAD